MRRAINGAKQEAQEFAEQQADLKNKVGTDDVKLIRKIRVAIQNDNESDIAFLKEFFPKAFAGVSAEIGSALKTKDKEPIEVEVEAAVKQKPIDFAFTSFADAVRNIQTSLGKEKDQELKKQTGIMANIDSGIQKLVAKPQPALVGV